MALSSSYVAGGGGGCTLQGVAVGLGGFAAGPLRGEEWEWGGPVHCSCHFPEFIFVTRATIKQILMPLGLSITAYAPPLALSITAPGPAPAPAGGSAAPPCACRAQAPLGASGVMAAAQPACLCPESACAAARCPSAERMRN